MALITLPVTVPVPANVPQADFNIGRFDAVTNWLTLNRNSMEGLSVLARKGGVGGLAEGALNYTMINGYEYPIWTDVADAPIIQWLVPKPGATFSLVSMQRFDDPSTEPWGISFSGTGVSGNPFLRPVIRGAGANSGVSVSNGAATNVIYSTTTPRPALSVGTYSAFVFKFADMNVPEVLISNDGSSFSSTGSIAEYVGATIADTLGITIGEASPNERMNGPVLDLILANGDISQRPDIMAAIHSYVPNDLFGGA